MAKDLLGKLMCRRRGGKTVCLRIIETEAYGGEEDLASHARFGWTKRNAPMYASGGRWYVYFTYGMHWMLNIVTEEKGFPAAVLIRGTENISGPARLTKVLQIDKRLNGEKLGKKSELWIEDAPDVSPRNIRRTPRIGVAYAKDGWAEKPYRFVFNQPKG